MEFTEWLAELRKLIANHDDSKIRAFYQGCADESNADAWKQYYEDGYTPERALTEDITCI